MLRQITQALRFAIADFFDVPAPAVAALLVAILFLVAGAYVRTIYGASSHFLLQMALLAGALIGIRAAINSFKRR